MAWFSALHQLIATPAGVAVFKALGWLEVLLQIWCVVAILARRREPSVTLAWLLGVALTPLVGLVLFWFFGRAQVRRRARPRLRLLAERRAEEREANLDLVPPPLRALARTAWETGRAPVTPGNRVDVLVDGAATYPAKLSAIRGATRQIDAAYYIFDRDDTGRQFRDALVEAAERGVLVRVLVDALGSTGFAQLFAPSLRRFFRPLVKAGGQFETFLPVTPLNGFSLNLRNHRKVLVVDGAIAFTGGLNVGDAYLRGTEQLGAWRDTDLRIEGPAVAQLQAVFDDDWAFTTKTPMSPKPDPAQIAMSGTCPLQIVPSGPDDRAEAIYNVFFAAISAARRTLDLSTPYFVPDLAIWVAIRSAAMRGVRVRILVPSRSDQPLTQAASRSYGEELMGAGVEFYRYLPGMMHAKVMIVDGEWASVGTANMDVRSFRLNFEVNALIYEAACVAPLQAAFERDLQGSELVDARQFSERSFFRRATEGFARLLSPLL